MKWKVAAIVLLIAFIGFGIYAIAEVDKKNRELVKKDESVAGLTVERDRLKGREADLTREAAKKSEEANGLQRSLADEKAKLAQSESALSSQKDEADQKIKSLEENVKTLTEDNSKRVAELTAELEQAKQSLQKEVAAKEAAQKQVEALGGVAKEMTIKLAELNEKCKALQQEIDKRKSQEKTPTEKKP